MEVLVCVRGKREGVEEVTGVCGRVDDVLGQFGVEMGLKRESRLW